MSETMAPAHNITTDDGSVAAWNSPNNSPSYVGSNNYTLSSPSDWYQSSETVANATWTPPVDTDQGNNDTLPSTPDSEQDQYNLTTSGDSAQNRSSSWIQQPDGEQSGNTTESVNVEQYNSTAVVDGSYASAGTAGDYGSPSPIKDSNETTSGTVQMLPGSEASYNSTSSTEGGDISPSPTDKSYLPVQAPASPTEEEYGSPADENYDQMQPVTVDEQYGSYSPPTEEEYGGLTSYTPPEDETYDSSPSTTAPPYATSHAYDDYKTSTPQESSYGSTYSANVTTAP